MGDDVAELPVSSNSHTKEHKTSKSKFERLLNVGRKLLPKPCDSIFVPSSISPRCIFPIQMTSDSSSMSKSQCTDDLQHLADYDFYHRKTSTPASVGVDLPALSINTFGGEAAGSGYGWINAEGVGEPYHSVDSVIRAQQIGLQMVNERIKWTQQQIESCHNDEQMIMEYVAKEFGEELDAIHKRLKYLMLRDTVKRLEKEVDELLAKLSRKPVPFSGPAQLHQHITWSCMRCHEENPPTAYRCKCLFPRPAIDPREAVRCNCIHCSEVTAERMFISPTPGDGDWLLVNRLSLGNGIVAHR